MSLNEKDRRALYDYSVKIGFIIQEKDFCELKTKEERLQRIKHLMNLGYRIQLWGKEFCVINIQGRTISPEIEKELKEAYAWLRGRLK